MQLMELTEKQVEKSESKNLGCIMIKRLVFKRFQQKKNTFIMWVGANGSGKSISALAVAREIQPSFSIEEQIVYTPEQLLDRIKMAISKKWKVLMIDEAQTTMDAKRFMSLVNRAIAYVATTFRELHNLCIMVIAPAINGIDKDVRQLGNYYAVCHRSDIEHKTVSLVDFYEIGFNYYDLKDQSPYIQTIFFKMKGETYKLEGFRISEVDEDLIRRYSETSKKYKMGLLEQQIEKLIGEIKNENETSINNKVKDPVAIADRIMEDKRLYNAFIKTKKDGDIQLRVTSIKRMFKLDDIQMFDIESRILERLEKGI